MHRNLTVFSLVVAVSLVSALSSYAEGPKPMVMFGTEGEGRISKFSLMPFAEGKAEISAETDHLAVKGPNFWSIAWQMNGVPFDLSQAPETGRLALLVSGTVQDEGPFIRVLLFSQRWERMSMYEIDISTMDAEKATPCKATTLLDKPIVNEKQKKQPLTREDTVGGMQLITRAERGNQPWNIKVYGMAVVPEEPEEE